MNRRRSVAVLGIAASVGLGSIASLGLFSWRSESRVAGLHERDRIRQLEIEIAGLRIELKQATVGADVPQTDLSARRLEIPVSTQFEEHGDEEPDVGGSELTAGRQIDDRFLDMDWLREHLPPELRDLSEDELRRLRTLDLGKKEITDRDLVHIEDMRSLEEFNLKHASITDDGMRHLRSLTELRDLNLAETQFTGEGLQWLPVNSLRTLLLNETKLTDSDLHSLVRFSSLQKLNLDRTSISYDGLLRLGSFPSLRHLEIDGTAVTAVGLRELLRCNPKLARIEVRHTAVTKEDVAQLLEEFPGRDIAFESGTYQLTQGF